MDTFEPISMLEPGDVLSELTLEEKTSLLSGASMMQLAPVARLGVPSLKVTDGPNGTGALFSSARCACFPAPVSIAASFDLKLGRAIGNALAEQAAAKGASLLLGPTVCPHRSPLGGRNFESFSEDPLLAGLMASQYVMGLQEMGIGATLKHYACNEQETARQKINVVVSERALREIYLRPFEIAIKESSPTAVMTAYNMVNGVHSDASQHLVKRILREQWGFDGLVMSDYGAITNLADSIQAGVDLEMPGPGIYRTVTNVEQALYADLLDMEDINQRAFCVLKFIKRVTELDKARCPNRNPNEASTWRKMIREAGSEGIVVLKNENHILPLNPGELQSIAVLGLAQECLAHGGGSAAVESEYKVTPYEALEELVGQKLKLSYAKGARTFRTLPDWTEDMSAPDGSAGLFMSFYSSSDLSSQPVSTTNYPATTFMSIEHRAPAVTLEGCYRPSVTGQHYLLLHAFGSARLLIDGKTVLESSTNDLMGLMIQGKRAQFEFRAGQDYQVRVECLVYPGEIENPLMKGMLGFHLGMMHQSEMEGDLVSHAAELAESSDMALIFVGNTSEWETEGFDSEDMKLPGTQNELIEAVAAVNENVVVVNSTCMAIEMPWIDKVSSVVQTWFPGQEAGYSIVDVLFGKVNPSGKLPISIPRTLEDTPSYGNFPGNMEKLEVRYEEGIEIGYRYFDKHPDKVLFPFGFGLSYSTFLIEPVKSHHTIAGLNDSISLEVDITNTSNITGKEVVQVYLSQPSGGNEYSLKVLAGFAKVELYPSQSARAKIEIPVRAASFWDESSDQWKVEVGEYELLVGSSSSECVNGGSISAKDTLFFKP